MPISKESLKGYILEEVLAYLIKNTGYSLLTDESDDPHDLTNTRSGLAVKGRGAIHQVDVLGQLRWIPAFTYPLRLFVEAKFREQRIGLPTVRNAVGVIADISQKNLPDREAKTPSKKFHYAYSLFSTSGFTRGAQDMAVAHQISLIDLSGPEYNILRDRIDSMGERMDVSGDRGKLVYNLRHALRTAFGTNPPQSSEEEYTRSPYDAELVSQLVRTTGTFTHQIESFGELFVGMAEGPFMLLLKADDPGSFLEYANSHPKHRIRINWSSEYQNARVWVITPVESPQSYRMEFRIPKVLDDWIFETSKDISRRALAAKLDYLSRITIYHSERDVDRVLTLEFDPRATLRESGRDGQSSLN